MATSVRNEPVRALAPDHRAAIFTCCLFVLLLPPSVCLAQDGVLDPTFGTGGLTSTDFLGSSEDIGRDVALQDDGRIIVVGKTPGLGGDDFALVRYTADGNQDASFGSGGLVITDFSSRDDEAYSVALQTDGKIVVVGSTTGAGGSDIALARYNADGSLDANFGSGGLVVTDFGSTIDVAFGLAIQTDGKIVVVGRAFTSTTNFDFGLARYNADGSLDASFGTGGLVTTDIGPASDQAIGVALQADGKIVAVGNAFVGSFDFAVARYHPDGSLDTGFGSGGLVTTDFASGHDQAVRVTLQPDGKIVVGGAAYNVSGYDFALARYDADGNLDASFGSGGLVTTDLGFRADGAGGLAIQADGKILLAGGNDLGSNGDFALARYDASGNLDGSFSSGGLVTTDFSSGEDRAYGIVIQADGKIILSGRAFHDATNFDFALARYDATFKADDAIDQIVDWVDTFVDAGLLDQNDGDKLAHELDKALKDLDKGDPDKAVSDLEKFIDEINKLIDKGEISQAEGQTLIDAASVVIAQLQGQSPSKRAAELSLQEVPTAFALAQNYPNPFNPVTTIRYELPKAAYVTLQIFDALGREVATLMDESKAAGRYDVVFDAHALPSGVYLYRLTAGSFVETRRLTLLK